MTKHGSVSCRTKSPRATFLVNRAAYPVLNVNDVQLEENYDEKHHSSFPLHVPHLHHMLRTLLPAF